MPSATEAFARADKVLRCVRVWWLKESSVRHTVGEAARLLHAI